MKTKVSKEEFIDAIIKYEDKVNAADLASQLGISRGHFFELKKKYKGEMAAAAKDYASEIAYKHIRYLDRNGEKGDTKASLALLQIAEVYVPKSNVKLDHEHKITVIQRYLLDGKQAPGELKETEGVKAIKEG